MGCERRSDDVAQIVVVTKFLEEREGGAAQGKAEIGHVGNIGRERYAVGGDKQRFQGVLQRPGVDKTEREQRHHDVEEVGIDDGREVEAEAAAGDAHVAAERHVGVQVAVEQEKARATERE